MSFLDPISLLILYLCAEQICRTHEEIQATSKDPWFLWWLATSFCFHQFLLNCARRPSPVRSHSINRLKTCSHGKFNGANNGFNPRLNLKGDCVQSVLFSESLESFTKKAPLGSFVFEHSLCSYNSNVAIVIAQHRAYLKAPCVNHNNYISFTVAPERKTTIFYMLSLFCTLHRGREMIAIISVAQMHRLVVFEQVNTI